MGRNILLIGIGQTGCKAVDIFARKMSGTDIFFRSIAIDTDETVLEKLNMSAKVPLIHYGDLGSVAESLGEENIKSWFPCDWQNDYTAFVKNLDMRHGANQWRMKAMLSFASFLSNKEKAAMLHTVLDEFNDETELYVVASLAGGTGSGLMLPITLYVKDYLKNAGCEIVYSTAMLAMPAIYENCYSEKQIVKSRANAYAALRELNAVNITTVYGGSLEYGALHAPIKFKIGESNEETVCLFDSENEKYHSKQYKPFDKAVLFERIAGVMSVDTHIASIADILVSLCTDDCEEENNKSGELSLYGGISLTKVIYPVDKIAGYISKRMLHTYIREQLCEIHTAVSTQATNDAMSSRAYGDTDGELQSRYCKKYVEMLDSMVEECDESSLLLGKPARLIAENIKAILNQDRSGELLEAVNASMTCEAGEALELILASNSPENAEKAPKKRKEIRKKFFEDAEQCKMLVLSYYRELRDSLQQGNNDFIQSLTATEKNGFSLLDNVMLEDGKYLDPVLALARLCQMANTVESRIRAIAKKSHRVSFEDTIPECLLTVGGAEEHAGKYFKNHEKRFAEFMAGKDPDLKHLINKAYVFFEDVESVYRKIKLAFTAKRLEAVLMALRKTIDKYTTLLDQFCIADVDMSTDQRLSLIESASDNGHTVNVGAETYRKEELYEKYRRSYLADEQALLDDGCSIGKLICDFVMGDTDDSICKDELNGIFDSIERVYRARLDASDFYREVMDKNIFCAMIEASNAQKDISAVGSSRFFMGRRVPLAYGSVDSYEERKNIKSTTLAILPAEVREYIAENAILSEGETPEMLIQELMYKAGEYHGQVCFSDRIKKNELYIRKEIFGLPLYTVEAVNEIGDDCTCFKAYNTAILGIKLHMTQMWNPDMIYSRIPQMKPFISATKQNEYELATAKALMAALSSQYIATCEAEEAGEVYCMGYGSDRSIICIGDMPIQKDDIHSLMLWLYSNTALTEELSAQYDSMFERSRKEFPSFDGNLITYRYVAAAVKNASVFENLRLVLAGLLMCLEDRGESDTWYGYKLMYAADKTFKDYCLHGMTDFDEVPVHIYNELMYSFYDTVDAVCGNEKSHKLLKLANEKGFFNKYYLWENI